MPVFFTGIWKKRTTFSNPQIPKSSNRHILKFSNSQITTSSNLQIIKSSNSPDLNHLPHSFALPRALMKIS
jgi:hypothetical protein